MQVGDKVIADNQETEIIATAFDEEGIKVYMVKGSKKDYYEEELKLVKDVMLEMWKRVAIILDKFSVPSDIKLLTKFIEDLVNRVEEQEKIIELMNEYILKNCVSLEICSKQIGKECYIDVIYGDECKECVLDYFRQKAKGE